MIYDRSDGLITSAREPESGTRLRSKFFGQKASNQKQRSPSPLVLTNEMILSSQIAKMNEAKNPTPKLPECLCTTSPKVVDQGKEWQGVSTLKFTPSDANIHNHRLTPIGSAGRTSIEKVRATPTTLALKWKLGSGFKPKRYTLKSPFASMN